MSSEYYKDMSVLRLLVLLIAVSFLWSCAAPDEWEYADPEKKRFSEEKLDTLASFLEKRGSSGMMILVDGKVVFDWGETKRRHTIHSIRKPLISALYGIQIERGIIDTNMTLGELGLDDINPLSEKEKSARIADLLKSRSGVYHSAAAVSDGMKNGMPERGSFGPGEHYYYNNWDFNVLASNLERKTGKSIYNLFHEQIAHPIGMQDYRGKYVHINLKNIENEEEFEFPDTDGFYQYEPDKSKYPAAHFRLSARDMARFGQLYLNDGMWKGRQIIPKEWIAESTKPYSVYNPTYGIAYGMLWSVLMKTETRGSASFFHTGTGVHMLGVYPASKMVLVHRVNTEEDYTFKEGDFYRMIDLVFSAREK